LKLTLQSLRNYQEVLSRIAELDELLAFVPPEIVNLETEWLAIQKKIEDLAAEKIEQETKLKERELLLSEARSKAEKFEKDLHEVTNTKEYHAVLKEIDTSKKQVSGLEDEIKRRKDELAENARMMDECVGLEKESKTRYETDLTSHEEKQFENRKERDKLLVKRTSLASKIPARLMKQFDRIASRRNGVGLSLCVAAVCQACNVRVRQNVVDQLRKYDRIINCESCKRMLFFSEGDN